ncbi:MAG: hypothetical protein OEV44_11580 [Spirochaetota bacterium]|nr:hypothetical protein [Spirochaetota bacterium]
MRNIYFLLLIISFLFFTVFSFAINKSKISYGSLNYKTLVIGSLGKPLGKIITIEGSIIDGESTRTKEDSGKLLLEVYLVDGVKLKKPVIINYSTFSWASIKNIRANNKFKYIGYETGGMTGIPDDAFKYIPRVATKSYGFSVYFQICKEVS